MPPPLCLLHCGQVLHQEYAPFRGLDHGHGVLQHRGVFAVPRQLYRVSPEVLHQLYLEAAQLQGLEGLVPLSYGLELEAIEVLVVVIGQHPEDLTVIKEVLEDPAACRLEHGDSLAPGEHVEGIRLQREASGE